jgi:hypothetical protein
LFFTEADCVISHVLSMTWIAYKELRSFVMVKDELLLKLRINLIILYLRESKYPSRGLLTLEVLSDTKAICEEVYKVQV